METEDQKDEAELQGLYKTKLVQFLGRSVPIILQNDNGPCPLIAICNVLLLRNFINISSEASEISLKKLLSLVAGRLLDSNGDIQDKDAGYVENQQRNIQDAIEMLPRLATGLDVNLHFTRIDEFEFTPERSIFDLLGIELYHGWIVDPQDTDTLKAIGSKSYNALMEEIVSLEDTGSIEGELENTFEEDPIDFAAATTATLGVPSPSLSRTISFDDSKVLGAGEERIRKGDREEEEELLRVLQLSKANLSPSSIDLPKDPFSMGSPSGTPPNSLEGSGEDCQRPPHPETCTPNHHSFAVTSGTEASQSFFKVASENDINQLICNKSGDSFISSNFTENMSTLAQNRIAPVLFQDGDYSAGSNSCENHTNGWIGDQPVQQTCMIMDDLKLCEVNKSYSDDKHPVFPDLISTKVHSSFTDETRVPVDVSVGSVVPNLDGSEPIYEGEECIIDAGRPAYEIHEPMYEGEMVLAEQADRVAGDAANMYPNDELSKVQTKVKLNISGELIRNFVKNSASQLTIYGLFCLQEGLKERELCVFFRNNHFSTMFKFNGELYLLTTDQGYINQPDLVWEKLNEVNGDTIFVTGRFTQFNAESHDEAAWDDKKAMANTSDYLATIDNSTAEGSFLNSDMQLAIALQQQEFEQRQPQRQPPCTLQQRSDSETSRLSKDPQGSRSSSSPKSEEKSKDKCAVM